MLSLSKYSRWSVSCVWLLLLFFGAVAHGSPESQASLFPVNVRGKHGYINQQGIFAVSPQFEGAGDFSDGLAMISVGSGPAAEFGYIDPQGRIVIQPQFEVARAFSEGLAAVRVEGKWGYINLKGETVIKPQFDQADFFSDGLARVKVKSQFGFIVLNSNR